MHENFYTIFASAIAIVIVFLFAIEKFSKQIQNLEGNKFKFYIKKFTDTPLNGTLIGAGITSILQSSTAVSVLLVSMTSAGVIHLSNSLAVIIGTNIGTTITSQLIAFKILSIAPYILILGFLMMKIKSNIQKFGKSIFYFGLIFSCLYIISFITSSIKDAPFILNLLSHTNNLFLAILFGFIISNILQSSSITIGIVIILASQGALNIEQSIGLLFGTNIGTTTTAIIASLATNKEGKRVAVGHLLFNLIGVMIFVPFISIYTVFITSLSEITAVQVAYAHLFFNIINAIIFLIFFSKYENLVKFIIK